MPLYKITRVKLMRYATKLGDYYCLTVPKVAERLVRLGKGAEFDVLVDPTRRRIVYEMVDGRGVEA